MPSSKALSPYLFAGLLAAALVVPAQEMDEEPQDIGDEVLDEELEQGPIDPEAAAPPVTGKKIYRSIGPDGSIVFSDKPSAGAEEVDLSEPTVLDAPPPPAFVPTSRSQPTSLDRYTSLSISSPANDEAIRENAGNVAVNVAMAPDLASGDEVVLLLDGQEVADGDQTSFTLENLDRGTHQLRAVVRGPDGSILKNSPAITFHLLRHSKLHPQSTVGKPPKPPGKKN